MKLNTLLFYTDLVELQAALQHFFGTQTPTTIYLYLKVPAPKERFRQPYPQYHQESLQQVCEAIIAPVKDSLKSTKHITWVVQGSDKCTNYVAYIIQTQQATLSLWQKIGQFFNQKSVQTAPTPIHTLPATAPRLHIGVEDYQGSHSHSVNQIITTIGRTASIRISVADGDQLVSKHHAQLVLATKTVRDARGNAVIQDQWYIEDMSVNGIWINGKGMITRYAELNHGDSIQLGGTDVVGKCPKLTIDIKYPALAKEEQRTFYKPIST